MDSRCSSSADSRADRPGAESLTTRLESYEAGEKKCISDVRRTFCLFVTFDLLFISLLWIIELNVTGGIAKAAEHGAPSSVPLSRASILAYAVCRLNHWSQPP
ncbi:hypothetical protein CRUP_014423 [Coryphaenoides rupestris]|nr:hypothetical protein CRUP_014423 [Coryphaenoides rupestris]